MSFSEVWCLTTDCSKVKNRGHPVFCKQSIFPANNRLLGGKTDQCRLVRGEQPMNNRLFGKTDQALKRCCKDVRKTPPPPHSNHNISTIFASNAYSNIYIDIIHLAQLVSRKRHLLMFHIKKKGKSMAICA